MKGQEIKTISIFITLKISTHRIWLSYFGILDENKIFDYHCTSKENVSVV